MATRPIDDIKKIRDVPVIRKKVETMMQFLFTNTQDNLNQDIEWGDEDTPNSSGKKPSTITDKGLLLNSGTPPYWKNDNTISIEYTAPHSMDVEFGRDPGKLSLNEKEEIKKWVKRKLGITKKNAHFVVSRNIINNIEKNGILPHPFIRPGLHALQRKYGLTLVTEPRK